MSAVLCPAATNTGKIWFQYPNGYVSFAPARCTRWNRTKWGINLLMISLIWDRRAYPVLGTLPKKETVILRNKRRHQQVLPLLKEYKTVVLGTGNFACKTWYLAIKQSLLLCASQTKWICAARRWNWTPEGVSRTPELPLYLNGECGLRTIYACSMWHGKRKYWGKDGLSLTNLSDLESHILAYKTLWNWGDGRDFKSGGYNLKAPGSQEIAWLC